MDAELCFNDRVAILMAQSSALSFDDLVGSRQDVGRNYQPDLFSRFEIDDELKLGWLLDGKVGGPHSS